MDGVDMTQRVYAPNAVAAEPDDVDDVDPTHAEDAMLRTA